MATTTPRPVQPEDLLAFKTVTDAQISPDGSRVAYVLTSIDTGSDEYRSTIWLVPATGGEPVQLTRGPKRDLAPRWSPDGLQLAFLSDRDGERPQLYLLPMNGGEARKLTALDQGAGMAVWSPDGTRICFAARVLTETPPKDAEERKRWERRPRVVTKAHYKADGQGYTFGARTHLFVVDVSGGEPRQITDGDCDETAPAWSPDGSHIAYSRTRGGATDYLLSDLWVCDADGGNARQLTENVGRATSPSWSPDGATIACFGGDAQRNILGDPTLRVWIVPSAGGAARNLTADYDRSPTLQPPPAITPGPLWSADGATLTFSVADAGDVHIVRASVADGSVRKIVAGECGIPLYSGSAAAGRIAFVATSPDNPADVYTCAWDGADERRLTRINEPVLAALTFPRVQRRIFQSPNGGTMEGWLTLPVQRSGPAPLLLHIHGGPAGFSGNSFGQASFYSYVLACRGWAVLALNPSGSGSYGKAFAHALRGRWGEYDLPEQLAAIDALVAEGVADPERLAVTGYSYGGYMTSWTVGHTDRFKAAVVGAPVTNLESFHGTSDIGLWFGPWEMGGDDLFSTRETFRRLSPVNYVDRVTTPTLILHGEADDRCPVGQGEEFYIGLLAAGKVPTQFVRYPDGSHLFITTGRPSHRLDFTRRVIDWVEQYTLQSAGAAQRATTAVPAD